MSKKYFGGKAKALARRCVSCKQMNPVSNESEYCEECQSKRCKVCGKIRLFQCHLVEYGSRLIVLCDRHFSAFGRLKANQANLKYLSDRELADYIESLQLDIKKNIVEHKIATGQIPQVGELNPVVHPSVDFDDLVERMLSGEIDSSDSKPKE